MLKNIYNQRITILNKLKREDNNSGVDIWQKTVIDDAVWYKHSESSVGVGGVSIGTVIQVLIPFHDEYLPYLEWRQEGKQKGHYTMSTGDYIIRGNMTEDVDASNIVKTLQKYGEDVCQVKSQTDNYKRFGARVQLYIEGV